MSETPFSSREARRTTHLPAPVRERLRPVARASEGAGEECRSGERDTLFVSRSVTNDSPSSARARAQRLNKMGEAPVKYELAGAS